MIFFTSQQELAIWQPAWPTGESQHTLARSISIKDPKSIKTGIFKTAHTVQADNLSHCVGWVIWKM
jgi:hypothetical protein